MKDVSPDRLRSVSQSTFELPSADGSSTVVGDVWEPPQGVQPVAIVQLIHGMVEHIRRYDVFARELAVRGCVVVGHDHLGHGRSVPSQDSWGVLAPNAGAEHLVADVQSVRLWADARHPGLPHAMFGHSMGSFVLRTFLGTYGDGLAGAVLCGTGWQPPVLLAAGRAVTAVVGRVRGWNYRSAFVDSLATGAYARVFTEEEGGDLGWLTRDPAHRDAYRADPACRFVFSVGAYHELFRLIDKAQSRSTVRGMPASLPVFLISGTADPVGRMGKAVPKVAALMRSCGVQDVEEKLYPGARHELLNETNRLEVVTDVTDWLERKGILHA